MTNEELIARYAIPILIEAIEQGKTTLTYGDLAAAINDRHGLSLNPHYGLGSPLGSLQKLCAAYGAPCLPAMVVTKSGGTPSGGFIEPYRKLHPLATGMSEDEICILEQERIRTYENWQGFLDHLGIEHQVKKTSTTPLSADSAKHYFEYVQKKNGMMEFELTYRNRTAREKCLELQGMRCAVCGFDSMEKYGIPGIIHVHHKDPVADMDDKREVDPAVDLVPLCPNCHALVHSKKNSSGVYKKEDVYTIKEAQAMWEEAQAKATTL